jgi:cytochrome bd-type quinol oxidase subunit 2
MSIVDRLVRLYPQPFQAQWGADIRASTVRIHDVPGLALGIADMWLHPAVWPADTRQRRLNRVCVTAVALAMASWLLSHLLVETDGHLTADATREAGLATSAVGIAIGAVLVAPWPRVDAAMVRWLAAESVKRLTIPAAVGAGAVLFAHTAAPSAPVALRLVILVCWYLAIASALFQTCRILATMDPARSRLPSATAAVVLSFAATTRTEVALPAAAGVALAALTLMSVSTTRDLTMVTSGELPATRT